jgi:hypothetical protein
MYVLQIADKKITHSNKISMLCAQKRVEGVKLELTLFPGGLSASQSFPDADGEDLSGIERTPQQSSLRPRDNGTRMISRGKKALREL